MKARLSLLLFLGTAFVAADPVLAQPPPPGKPGVPFPYAGLWYRPSAQTTGPGLRTVPEPFRPRGYGYQGVTPTSPYRLDYNRYVPTYPVSEHGPTYYPREPVEYIDDYTHGVHRALRPGILKCDRQIPPPPPPVVPPTPLLDP